MEFNNQLHNSLCFAAQRNHPVNIASKAGLAYPFIVTDQEGQWCEEKFTKNDVCKHDTISL
jgi:hypothetical protein